MNTVASSFIGCCYYYYYKSLSMIFETLVVLIYSLTMMIHIDCSSFVARNSWSCSIGFPLLMLKFRRKNEVLTNNFKIKKKTRNTP